MKKHYKKLILGLGLLVLINLPEISQGNSTTSEFKPKITHRKSVLENPYERLFLAIYRVESGCDSTKINRSEMAVGGLQIRRILLRDYYQRTGKRVLLYDTYKLKVSKEIFMYYAEVYGPDYESIARCWNGGLQGMRKESTKAYWDKVKYNL